MVTIDKERAVQSTLMNFYLELHTIEDKLSQFERDTKCSFEEFNKKVKMGTEDFDGWDTLMEWKAYEASYIDIKNKIIEVEHGEFTIS